MTDEPKPERELEEMQERADKLEQEIEDVRKDWDRKKGDSSVPGALDDQDENDK